MFGSTSEGHLTIENVDLVSLSKKYGTPLYVFSEREILKNYNTMRHAFEKRLGSKFKLAYSIKVSPLAAIVKMLSEVGALFEVGSLGEFYLVKKLGIDFNRLIYTSIYKPDKALKVALASETGLLAADSYSDLLNIHRIAKDLGVEVPILIRANPGLNMNDVIFASAASWSKTGVRIIKDNEKIQIAHKDEPLNLFRKAVDLENVNPVGIHGHLGSQVTSIGYYEEFTKEIVSLFIRVEEELGFKLKILDLGGGYPIRYDPAEEIPPIETIAELVVSILNSAQITPELIIESGRYIVGEAGMLLTKVGVIKNNPLVGKIVVTDACTYCDLLDSILVNWFFPIEVANKFDRPKTETARIVGGTNDSLDLFDPIIDKVCPNCGEATTKRRVRRFPHIEESDVLAIRNAGAYTISFNKNYCSRPIPPVVLIDSGGQEKLIRKRQSYSKIFEDQTL